MKRSTTFCAHINGRAADLPRPRGERVASELAELGDQAGTAYAQAAKYAELTGSLTEAIAHLERALELEHRPHGATMLADLANLYALTGRVGEAVTLFQRAVDVAGSANDRVVARILISQAHTLTRLNRFDAAYDAASRALTLSQDDEALHAAALDAMGNVCSKRGEHARALDYQNAALALRATIDDDQLAQILFRHGWCLKELGRYDEARSSLDESLALQVRDRPNWSRLAAAHNALADLDISEENYPQARLHLNQAVEAWRKFDQHADMAVALNSLANLANREQLFEEALTYGWDAHALDVELLGPDHPDVAFALTCIGESYIGLARYDAAIDALTRADALRSCNEVPEGNRAWTRWLLGRSLTESGRDAAAGVALVHQARSVFDAMGAAASSELKDVDAWLANVANG
jgi:eukaryotic-like serine/threonine-protein kinase